MKSPSVVSVVLVAIGAVVGPSFVRGQTGSAAATVGETEIRFIFPLTREDPVPPYPLPPPPEPPPPLPEIFPPSSPASLRIASSTEHELTLAWEPAEAAPGHRVVYYEILRNGAKVGESGETQVIQPYDSAGRVIEFFSVRAVDDQRARSALSNEVLAPRTGGPGELFFQVKTVFGRRDLFGFPGLIEGGSQFQRMEYTYQSHRSDPSSGSVLDRVDSIVETVDPDSGVVHNKSKLLWTGTGIYAQNSLSFDYEGDRNIPDFPGAVVDISRMDPFRQDPDKTDSHSRVEVFGPSDFHELSEITYSVPASGDDLLPGLEADLLQAQSESGTLAWGQTHGVSYGESGERSGLPLAKRGLGELVASDYRFGVPAGEKRHVCWAEIFVPDEGGENEILVINDELVDATDGMAFTSVHHVAPPDRPGVVAIGLLNEFAEALPAAASGARTFAPNTMFIGQGSHLQIAAASFALSGGFEPPAGGQGPAPGGPLPGGGSFSLPPPYRFSSIVLILDDPANAVRLFAIDPAIEMSAGIAQAIVHGQEIASGTDLATLQLPNGMRYGEWRLVALGQGAGSVELSLEYEHSPWLRISTHLEVYPAVEMAVDANRDHLIAPPSASPSDATAIDAPFRFWLNDDIDREHTVDETDREQDDIGPKEAAAEHWLEDWKYNFIASARDLEDFARLSLVTNGWESRLLAGEVLLGFKWTAVTGDPAIKLYRQSEPGGGTAYLTDSLQATVQLLQPALLDERGLGDDLHSPLARTMVGSADVFILPSAFWADGATSHSFLFEGCRAGQGCLRPVLLQRDAGKYVEIAEMPGAWFDLKKVGEMYEHWSVGNGDGAAPASAATRVAAETGDGRAFSYASDDPEERKYILFVHGWNMEKWEKERFAETAYKRLYWQGYRGRFGLFSWPTTYGFESDWDAISDSTNFDRGEFVAWRSGAPLRQLLQELAATYDGELYVFSHSMGAVVASEALRLQSDARGPQIAKVYVAGQAALSAHAYDGLLPETPGAPDALQWHYTHPRVQVAGNYGPDTPDVYRNWAAFIAGGSATSSASVGRVVNFYNENDFALSAPVWQFNQLTKPDFADFPDWLWEYRYEGDPAAAPTNTGFRKSGKFGNHPGEVTLRLGTRTDLADRYEIMAFAAESHVKALGATGNPLRGISGAVNLREPTIWRSDRDNHSAHKWHSGEFRSTIQSQRNVWKVLLGKPGFDLSGTGQLP